MSDEQPDQAKPAASKGAAEVDEKDLDQAAGGSDPSIYFARRQVEAPSRQDAQPPPDDQKRI